MVDWFIRADRGEQRSGREREIGAWERDQGMSTPTSWNHGADDENKT